MKVELSNIKRVRSFKNINLDGIDFVSFYYKNGQSLHLPKEGITFEVHQQLEDINLNYAFVNMIGGEFIIVGKHLS